MCQNGISLLCGSILQGISFWLQPATELQAAEGGERVLRAGLPSPCLVELLGSGFEPLTLLLRRAWAEVCVLFASLFLVFVSVCYFPGIANTPHFYIENKVFFLCNIF